MPGTPQSRDYSPFTETTSAPASPTSAATSGTPATFEHAGTEAAGPGRPEAITPPQVVGEGRPPTSIRERVLAQQRQQQQQQQQLEQQRALSQTQQRRRSRFVGAEEEKKAEAEAGSDNEDDYRCGVVGTLLCLDASLLRCENYDESVCSRCARCATVAALLQGLCGRQLRLPTMIEMQRCKFCSPK